MTDIEEYLNSNFEYVEKLDNGGYYCTDNHYDYNSIYIPPNVTTNMDMLSYLPGAGGASYDAYFLRQQIYSDTPPPYIISISGSCSDHQNTLETYYDGLTNLGVNIDNVVEMSFSASSGVGMERLESFVGNHPDVNCTMVCNNGVKENLYNIAKASSNFPNLINNNVPCIFVDPAGNNYIDDAITGLGVNNFNTYKLQTNSTDHMGFNHDMINNHFVDYLLGYTDELTNNRTYGGKALDIELLKVNPENGKYTDADYQEILDNFTNIHIPNISRLFRVDNFDITTSTYKDDTMGTLQNLNDLTITGAGKISSEVKYINNSMNSIRASVRSSSYLGGIETMNFRSSSGIPGCIGKYISAYYALVNQLLNYIALETEAVNSYGQAMVDMDNAMKNDALEIGEVVALDFDKNSKLDSSYTPVLDKKNDINITNGNNTNTNTNTNTNNRPSGSNTNNTGTNNSGGNNNNGYNYQDSEPEVLDEPKTYNFEFDDKHKAIIDTDGTKITNIRYQYTYKNMLEAKEASEKLLAEYQNKDFFDKIQVAGNKVYIYFKKDSFENLDMSQIQAKYLKGAKMING